VHERGIHFPDITYIPRMREIADGYGWMHINNMIGPCNLSWVEEFYANALAYGAEEYTSYVR
jgi:hypothetical protein